MIYLNNAATTLQKPPCVVQAVVEAINGQGSCGRGSYTSELSAARTIFHTREALARIFTFHHPERVVFTANATQALNAALWGLLNPGDHVIATDWDHNSVLRPLHTLAKERGVKVDYLPADRKGRLEYDQLEGLLHPSTKLLVGTHASNLTGNLLDVVRMSAFAQKHGLVFLLDAAQTAGSTPISMEEMGVHLLAFTGHKGLMGPQGTGGLCVRPGIDIAPLVEGGSGVHSFDERHPRFMPEALEAGTANAHGLAGLAAGCCWLAERGVADVQAHIEGLVTRFLDGVADIDGVQVLGGGSGQRCGIVAVNVGDADSGEIADRLAQGWGVCVRPGAHCAPLMHRALGTEDAGAVRFSFSHFTTEDEVDAAARALACLAREAT